MMPAASSSAASKCFATSIGERSSEALVFRVVTVPLTGEVAPQDGAFEKEKWQARRDSNPQPAVLETAALPIELLACIVTPISALGIHNSGRNDSEYRAD